MESLYSKAEEHIVWLMLIGRSLDHYVVTLGEAAANVLKSADVPYFLKPRIILRLHKVMQKLQQRLPLTEQSYARPIAHPKCSPQSITLGELWDLPLQSDWLCRDCSKPLYNFALEPLAPGA